MTKPNRFGPVYRNCVRTLGNLQPAPPRFKRPPGTDAKNERHRKATAELAALLTPAFSQVDEDCGSSFCVDGCIGQCGRPQR